MKRILLVTTSYPDSTEGEAAAGHFVRDYARALVAMGAEVHVVAPSSWCGCTVEEGVDVKRFAVPKLPLSLLSPWQIKDWEAIATTLCEGSRMVRVACDHARPDHILALWALPSGDWARRTGSRFGIPYSVWALGSDIWTLGRIPLLRQYLALTLRQAAYRFADGLQLAEDVERICRRPCDFMPSSRNFGPPGKRTMNDGPPYRLAFLGRWHKHKGVDLLLDALEMLSDEDWSRIAAVRIYGGGPLEALVHRGVLRLSTSGRPVEAGGYLDLEGARALFEWTDYVVIPSRIESIPVVFSDSMQAGRPVIVTPVGDLPRLVNDLDVGIVAKEATPAAFSIALQRQLRRPPVSMEGGIEVGRQRFDIAGAAARFLNVIEGDAPAALR